MILLGVAVHHTQCFLDRSVWVKERSCDWWDRIASGFSDEQWRENFRVSRETFNYLCLELKGEIKKKDTKLRQAVSVERRVAITLWRLATNGDYRSIGHMFGVAKGTVCVIVNDVCQAIVKVLLTRYVKFPSGVQLKKVVNEFEARFGFPQCVGAVDGTHIPILAPQQCAKDYYNRKGYHSILMQAVVDHQYCFTDIYIGWPGSVHDARVFKNSEIFRKCENGQLVSSSSRTINGVNVPLVILGDPAYPLLSWLMKPYSDNGKLTASEKTFNYRLSRARMVVENAFGRLKGRWRCLLKRNDMNLKNIPTVIAACVVLHNICEINKEQFSDEWRTASDQEQQEPPEESNGNRPADSSAQAIRNALKKFFIEHPL